MPHGAVVGGPYSSWLKKLPQRATNSIANRPGAITSAQAQNDWRLIAGIDDQGDQAGEDPAVDAEPGIGRQEDPGQVVLVQGHWSITW